jgi:hypothetical protein
MPIAPGRAIGIKGNMKFHMDRFEARLERESDQLSQRGGFERVVAQHRPGERTRMSKRHPPELVCSFGLCASPRHGRRIRASGTRLDQVSANVPQFIDMSVLRLREIAQIRPDPFV